MSNEERKKGINGEKEKKKFGLKFWVWFPLLLGLSGVTGTFLYDKYEEHLENKKLKDSRNTTVPMFGHGEYEVLYFFLIDESKSTDDKGKNVALLEAMKGKLVRGLTGAHPLTESNLSKVDFNKIMTAYMVNTVSENHKHQDKKKDRGKNSIEVYGVSDNLYRVEKKVDVFDEVQTEEAIKKILVRENRNSTNITTSIGQLINEIKNHRNLPKVPHIVSITIVSDFAEEDPAYKFISSVMCNNVFGNLTKIQFNLVRVPTGDKALDAKSIELIKRLKEDVDYESFCSIYVYEDFVHLLKEMNLREVREEKTFLKVFAKSICKPVVPIDLEPENEGYLLIEPSANIKGSDRYQYLFGLFASAENGDKNAKVFVQRVKNSVEDNDENYNYKKHELSLEENRFTYYNQLPSDERFRVIKRRKNPDAETADIYLKIDPCEYHFQFLLPLKFNH